MTLLEMILGALVITLLFYIKDLKKELKIQRSNYYNCLIALSMYDPKLKEFLEKNDRK